MADTPQLTAFRRVLVGIDGGPGGRDAIALARLLVATDGQVTLAHVHDGEEAPARGSNLSYDAVQLQDSRRLLDDERVAADLASDTVAIASPTVAGGLHRVVAERDADLLVVGSCRRGVLGRVTLGDDARASLRGANCVVAIAPQGYAGDPHPVRVIGVGYDGGHESEAALKLARAIARQRDASVRVTTVVTPPSVGYGAPLGIEFIEDDARQRLEALDGVDGQVTFGGAARELVAFADEVDLLVVGSHSRGLWGRAIFGSTSQHLARLARSPLLVVPHDVALHEFEVADPATGASA
jgi:nucleotide-binding universal stress UspA family protein